MSSHSSSMRTFRSSDSASEIGSSETSFSERSQPYFALCSPRSKSSVNVSNSGGVAATAGPGSTVGGSSSMSSGINHNNNNNANSNINNFKQPAAQQPSAVAYHHQPCRRSSSAKAANKPRPVVRRDLGHVNSFPDAHHNMHHKTPPGGGSSSTSYYTPPRSPSLSVTTPTDGPPRRSPTTPSSSAVFKFPSSAGSAITASSSSGGSAIVHHYGRSGGTNPNTPRTLPRSPSTGSAATSTSYNTNSDSACNTHRSASDLTECTGEDLSTQPASVSRPSSPRGRGLAYLASRRSSRDSQFSNEELAPLNFNATARGRQRRTSNFLELPVPDHVRPRVCSLPEKPYNPRSGDELYRLRTFSITNKGGVVNCGDSIINRRSRSNTSVNSTTSKHSPSNLSGISPFDSSCCGGNSSYNDLSSGESSVAEEIPKYRVVLLGESGVGKTALVSQFMTSEYMNTYDASLDDEFGEKTVSILLDGEESEMVFIDHPSIEMSHRKYVDPWDLDLREVSWRHSSDTTDCSADHQVVSLSSAAGPVSTRSEFVYVPGPAKSNKSGAGRTRARSVARYDCCQCSPSSSSMALVPPDPNENLYEYWEAGCKPPPYCRYPAVNNHFYPVTGGSSKQQCRLLYNVSRPEVRRNSRYNNGDMDSVLCRAYGTSSGEYNSAENLVTSQFRYNTLGHMKIDYSSNWNNLDKYICQV